jgi:hypothetical protein
MLQTSPWVRSSCDARTAAMSFGSMWMRSSVYSRGNNYIGYIYYWDCRRAHVSYLRVIISDIRWEAVIAPSLGSLTATPT